MQRIIVIDLEQTMDIFIKVFQNLLADFLQFFGNCGFQFRLKLIKCRLDLFFGTALIVYLQNFHLQSGGVVNLAQHIIRCTENTIKQLELVSKQFVYPFVCCITLVQKVDHNHIIRLPVTVAAANALFNALGIPR